MAEKKRFCVALVCNAGYLDGALFLADQLLFGCSQNFDVVLVSGDDLASILPESVGFRRVNMEAFTDGLPENARLKKFTYWRIPAIEALAREYEKVLYLDADIFLNAEGVGQLFEVDIQGYAIGAVRDVHQYTRPDRMPREFVASGMKNAPYFNAGVLLVNSAVWLEEKLFDVITLISRSRKDVLFCHDQSLLNIATAGKWVELSPVWNWQYSNKNCYLTEFLSPKLIHFAGEKKIWHSADGTVPRRYWEAYRSYLRRVLLTPHAADQEFPVWAPDSYRQLGRILLKNLWYFRAHMRYIARFPHSTYVIKHGASKAEVL